MTIMKIAGAWLADAGVRLSTVDELFVRADEPHMIAILYPLDDREMVA